MEDPRVSVVIPTLNRREELRRTLSSLFTQSLPSSYYETVVVIDGSTDGTREMLSRLRAPGHLVSHFQPRRGRAAAVNAGVRLARGEVLVFLDDDIVASDRLLEEHYRYLDHHSGHAGVGAAPMSIPADAPAVVRLVGEKMNAHLRRISQPGFQFRERDFYSGNFAVERSLFLKVGGFDEDFTLYGNEDCELARRLLLHGVPIVYNPRAIGYQHYTKTFAQLVSDTYEKGRTRVLFGRKHPDIASTLGVIAPPTFSWRLQFLMALLQRLPRRMPRSTAPLVRLIAMLDRRWPALVVPRYRAILDLYFWLGVADERRQLC